MKLKRLHQKLALLLSIAFILSMVPIAASAEGMANFKKGSTYSDAVFTDVPATQWYYSEVANAYAYGLAGGVGNNKFNPTGNVTVAEAIVFAVRVNAVYNGADQSTITAAAGSDWYTGYVNYAEQNNICKAGEYAGQYTNKATRSILAHLLANALPESEFAAINTKFAAIPDMMADAAHYDQVLMLFKAGILSGSDLYANFKADSNITRAEAVAIVNRVVDPTQRKTLTPFVGTVKLSQSTLSIRPGATAQLTATAANGIDNGGKVLWKSSNEKVATVSDAGIVTGVADGTANVYATETNGTKNSENCVVTVGAAKTMTSVDIFKQVSPAVFYIELYDSEGDEYATASGFFVTADGVAYTNFHVIDEASSAKITLPDGTTYKDITVIGYNRLNDIAVLKVGGSTSFPHVTLGDSDSVQSGEKIYTIGNPKGLKGTISDGMVSNLTYHRDDSYKSAAFLQISAPISSGSSGGTLINEYGEVIGITTSGYTSGQNLNFAVPINIAKNITKTAGEELSALYDRLYGSIPEAGKNEVNSNGNNLSYENAQEIKNGDTVEGTLASYQSEHYYSITTEGAGVLNIMVASDKTNQGNVTAFLVDENDKVIDISSSITGSSAIMDYADFYLEKAGTYRVFIASYENKGKANVPYVAYFAFSQN